MRLTLDDWQADVIDYRCSLPLSEVRRLRGTTSGWDCRDVKLFIGEVSFKALDQEMQDDLNAIPTRLKLKTEQVDLAIAAGRMATEMNPEFNGFKRASRLEAASVPGAGGRGIAPRRISPVSH